MKSVGPWMYSCRNDSNAAGSRSASRHVRKVIDRGRESGVSDAVQHAFSWRRASEDIEIDIAWTLGDERSEVRRNRFDVDSPPAFLRQRKGDRVLTWHPSADVDPEAVVEVTKTPAQKRILPVLGVGDPWRFASPATSRFVLHGR